MEDQHFSVDEPSSYSNSIRLNTCERPETRCRKWAEWLVQYGTRKSDAQRSCGHHLASTCSAMLSSGDVNHPLTVTWRGMEPKYRQTKEGK